MLTFSFLRKNFLLIIIGYFFAFIPFTVFAETETSGSGEKIENEAGRCSCSFSFSSSVCTSEVSESYELGTSFDLKTLANKFLSEKCNDNKIIAKGIAGLNLPAGKITATECEKIKNSGQSTAVVTAFDYSYSCQVHLLEGDGDTSEEEGEESEKNDDPDISSLDLKVLNQFETTDPKIIIGRVIQTAMGVMGSIALAMSVYGGILWLTAMGNSERQKKGTGIILWSALGVIVILSSYALVKFVFEVF